MFTSPLLSVLNVPSTRAAAQQAKLDDKCENRKYGGYPHEHEHFDSNIGFDIEFAHALGGCFEDNEDGGCKDGCDGCAECGEEGERSDGETGPAGEDCDWGEEDHDEVDTGPCEEETKHPL